MLSKQAKIDFMKDLSFGCEGQELPKISDLYLGALIIDWFDRVNIHICITPFFPMEKYGFGYNINLETGEGVFGTRALATKHAIMMANELYNK